MAASLNTPADFEKVTSKTVSREELLPPSLFEIKKPYTFEAETTNKPHVENEFEKIKKENQILKQRLKDAQTLSPSFPQNVYQMSNQLQQEQQNIKHQDIIKSHTDEISKLQRQLAVKEFECNDVTNKLQRELETKEKENAFAVDSLKKMLKNTEDQYQQQVEKLEEEKYKAWSEFEKENEALQGQLQQTKSEYEAVLNAIQNELDSTKEDCNSLLQQYSSQIKESESRVKSQDEKIIQLESALAESEKQNKSTEAWRAEVHCLNEKIQSLDMEKKMLQDSIELLNIRLKSQNEILLLQENEISKGKEENENDEHDVLLTRWREKVFALLVQKKSTELVIKDENRKYTQKLAAVNDELSKAKNQIGVLQHTLADRNAELDIEKNQVKTLQAEITHLQQLSIQLDNKNQIDMEAVLSLNQFSKQFWDKYQETEEKFRTASETLKKYGQRLVYTNGRLNVLQGQFTRREALLKMQLEEKMSIKDCENDSNAIEQLQGELNQLIRERNQLVEQIKEDAILIDEKIKTAKRESEEEVVKLKQNLENATEQLELKTQRSLSLSEKLETTEKYVEELTENVDKLKVEVAKHQSEMEKAVDEQRTMDHNEYTEQMAQLERQVNEARREHAKAVVSVRQMERQCTREKERSTEHVKSIEEYYTKHVDQLQAKVSSLEKDKNILMATLRQEGLLGKYKSHRGKSVTLEEVENFSQGPVEEQLESGAVKLAGGSNTSPDEALHTVIDELKTLTAEVISDDDDIESLLQQSDGSKK